MRAHALLLILLGSCSRSDEMYGDDGSIGCYFDPYTRSKLQLRNESNSDLTLVVFWRGQMWSLDSLRFPAGRVTVFDSTSLRYWMGTNQDKANIFFGRDVDSIRVLWGASRFTTHLIDGTPASVGNAFPVTHSGSLGNIAAWTFSSRLDTAIDVNFQSYEYRIPASDEPAESTGK